jgi:peroxiredoxin
MRYKLAVAALSLMLLLQIAAFARTKDTSDAPPLPELSVGDKLEEISAVDSAGKPVDVLLSQEGTRYTVLLAYDAGCAHTAKIATKWKEWLADPPRARVLAVANDPPDSAIAHRDRNGWNVTLVSVPHAVPGSREHILLRRSPWLFVFDSDGKLALEAHGARLASVDSLIAGTNP